MKIRTAQQIQNTKHKTPKHESDVEQIESLFHPRSVAIVGLPRGLKTGKLFLLALQDQKFSGDIYPVNPNVDEIDGLKTYPSVSAIPGPVDLAIVLVPSQYTLPVIKECVEKGVKGAILFTAGYRETHTREGIDLEKELVALARSGGMRIIGPNGMGFYVPASGLSFFPKLSRRSGNVGMISHSGSLTNILGRMASQRGIYFSKVVSIGNACDLAVTDFLDYFRTDPETTVIGGYIEGIPNGPVFLNTLKRASLNKAGYPLEGRSDPGRLPGGGISYRCLGRFKENLAGRGPAGRGDFGFRVRGLPGRAHGIFTSTHKARAIGWPFFPDRAGLAVSASEACGNEGLTLAELLPETQKALKEMIPPTGTSYKNPVDVGLDGLTGYRYLYQCCPGNCPRPGRRCPGRYRYRPDARNQPNLYLGAYPDPKRMWQTLSDGQDIRVSTKSWLNNSASRVSPFLIRPSVPCRHMQQ